MALVLWLTQNRLPVSQSQARLVISGSPVGEGQGGKMPLVASGKTTKWASRKVWSHVKNIAKYRCKVLSSVVRHSCKCCPGCRPRRTNLGPRQRSKPQGLGPRSEPHQSVVTLRSQVPMSLSAQSAGWRRHLEGTVINSSTGKDCTSAVGSFTARVKNFSNDFFFNNDRRFLSSQLVNTFVTPCLPPFNDWFDLVSVCVCVCVKEWEIVFWTGVNLRTVYL